MLHDLKTYPEYFKDVKAGIKTFEIRKADRNFKVGDELLLREYYPDDFKEFGDKAFYTGEVCHRKITYILKGGQFGIEKDYVVLSLKIV